MKKDKPKIVRRSLSAPMTEYDFQQLVLTASLIAILNRLIKREEVASRKTAYSILLRDIGRIESSIVGYLDPRVAEDSADLFYKKMDSVIDAFLRSFRDINLVGRDEKGRFTKL